MNQILTDLVSCENQIDTFFVNQRITLLLTGKYLLSTGGNNSLALLCEHPCDEAISWIEESIRQFLNKCMFCETSLFDVKADVRVSKVSAYRFGGQIIPIR